jgi:hypothetical protein
MIIKRRNFSQTRILGTGSASSLGFMRGRKYDEDLGRLGRMETSQRELHSKLGDLGKEQRKLTSEINRGFKPQDLKE